MNLKGSRWLRIVGGIVAANLVGFAFCCAFYFLFDTRNRVDQASSIGRPVGMFFMVAIWPSLVLMPLAMGYVAACFWRSLRLSAWQYVGWWFVAMLASLGGAFLILHEGAVCLVIASPILFVCGFAGVMLAATPFRPKPTTLNLSVIPLLFLMALVEGDVRKDHERVVEDSLHIKSAVGIVWKHVVAFPRIGKAPDYWLNRIGLPSPWETRCQGSFVGAQRECIFSDGLVFKEVVSEIKQAQRLTFEIVKQPEEPELLGHLTLHRGQFELVDNNDGTTTLIGRSWYTLHVRPTWYFDWWTRDVTSHVHLRVMEHIKALSEAER